MVVVAVVTGVGDFSVAMRTGADDVGPVMLGPVAVTPTTAGTAAAAAVTVAAAVAVAAAGVTAMVPRVAPAAAGVDPVVEGAGSLCLSRASISAGVRGFPGSAPGEKVEDDVETLGGAAV